MEGRDFFSEVGGVGESRVWRAAIHFLSTAVVAAGCGTGLGAALECGARGFYCNGADRGWLVRVCAGAKRYVASRGTFRRRVLCGESVCATGGLHAQRFCRAVGYNIFSLAGAVGVAR